MGPRNMMANIVGALFLLGTAALTACGSEPASPFDGAGGASVSIVASTATGGGEGGDGDGPDDDPTLGGPCTQTAQCDDGADCTTDTCDAVLARCRFTPDQTRCDDGIYCNGAELCTPRIGCETATPIDCGDDDACTIDTCDEGTQTCTREPRDADGDGDPDAHCEGGSDCDDTDPTRSSFQEEVCANLRDDDCDGEVDEDDCVAPANDDCEDALEITTSGVYPLQTAGASLDVGVSCTSDGIVADVFARVTIPDGPDRDLDVRVKGDFADLGIAVQADCGEPASEIACGGPANNPSNDPVARTIARRLAPGTYAVVVSTTYPEPLSLDVRILPATDAPENETCGTAEDAPIDETIPVVLVDAAEDAGTACPRQTGDLVYRFELEDDADVDVYAESVDGSALPSISFRDEACALPEDELVCATAPFAHVYRGGLGPGTYYLALSATAPTDATFHIATSAPTPRPEDETCEGAPTVAAGDVTSVVHAKHQDDHHPCITGAVDAAYALDVPEPSDVLLVLWPAQGDIGSVALTGAECGESDLVACSAAGALPVRLRRRGLGEGTWYALLESSLGVDQRFDFVARPAAPPITVPFADACEDAQLIPAEGGFFTGNTTSATADFAAGCDDAGGDPGGAPDRLLRLDLDEPARVIFDMSGTSYDALLDIRRGPDCPGVEVALACTVQAGDSAPYLDLDLEAGSYFVQVDGRGGDTGAFQLDAYVLR